MLPTSDVHLPIAILFPPYVPVVVQAHDVTVVLVVRIFCVIIASGPGQTVGRVERIVLAPSVVWPTSSLLPVRRGLCAPLVENSVLGAVKRVEISPISPARRSRLKAYLAPIRDSATRAGATRGAEAK